MGVFFADAAQPSAALAPLWWRWAKQKVGLLRSPTFLFACVAVLLPASGMDRDGGFFSQLGTVDQLQAEAKAGAVFQRSHRDEERKARGKMPHVLASSGFHAPDVQCVLHARDGIVVVCRLSVETHERHLPPVDVRRDDHPGLLGEIYGRLRSVQCLHDDFAHAAHVGRHTNGAMVEPLESWIEF